MNPHLKSSGSARFVFISRISRKKNLHWAINLFRHQFRGAAIFDIYGTLEDEKYWALCQQEIAHATIPITYRGMLPFEQVAGTFEQYDFFVFPTLDENYGHVIRESLEVGVPALLSYGCGAWSDIQDAGAGFWLPFEQVAWIKAIQFCIDCDLEPYRAMAANAFKYANKYPTEECVEQHRRMFQRVLEDHK